jgi:hypothetical protein
MDPHALLDEMLHDGVAPGAVTHAQPIDDKKTIVTGHFPTAFPGSFT